jgi:CHRD domain-containing protein
MRGRTRLWAVAVAVFAVVSVTAAGSAAMAGDDDEGLSKSLQVQLTGYQEDPLVLSTTGSGRFRAQVNDRMQTITYRLSYMGLEGTVTQAHIHIGGTAQSGGVSTFLCSNLGNAPAGTQICPAAPAEISGTITPETIIGPAGQGVGPGQFGELVAAIRAGKAYVNVHSSLYPGGEIRAQLERHH